MSDADLPPLPQLFPVADAAFTMRCMTDDALRAIQRDAFKAGLEKALAKLTDPARTPAIVGSIGDDPTFCKLLHNIINPRDNKRYTERAALVAYIDARAKKMEAAPTGTSK